MKKLILGIFLFVPFVSNAVTRTSVQNGNWNNASTWSPVGVPQQTDDTIIVATNVFLTGQHISFGNSLFRVAASGSLMGSGADTLTFGGDVLDLNSYLMVNVLIVGANDSVVNNGQIECDELAQSGTFINHFWICVANQLATSDDFYNYGSVSCMTWVNSGAVSGNQGQFCIAQNFINTDQISGNIDICDATPGGFGDVNTGTINSSVTNCAAGPCAQCIVPGYNEHEANIGIVIAPHPVTGVAVIILETNELQSNAQSICSLTDVHGRVIKEISFTGNQFSFDRSGMESGLYFYSIILPNGHLVAGKLLLD